MCQKGHVINSKPLRQYGAAFWEISDVGAISGRSPRLSVQGPPMCPPIIVFVPKSRSKKLRM